MVEQTLQYVNNHTHFQEWKSMEKCVCVWGGGEGGEGLKLHSYEILWWSGLILMGWHILGGGGSKDLTTTPLALNNCTALWFWILV